MTSPVPASGGRPTLYRWPLLTAAIGLGLLGGGLLVFPAIQAGQGGTLGARGALVALGLGPFAELAWSTFSLRQGLKHGIGSVPLGAFFWGGLLTWAVACACLAAGIGRAPRLLDEDSPAKGKPLYPRLASYRDFYWPTLAAYGGGMLLAEVVLILLHTLLATGANETFSRGLQLAPPFAFAISLVVAFGLVFWSGFIGTAHARRMSIPEATIAVVYFGLPIPILLTLVSTVFDLQLRFGPLLREILYVAGLLGRPELGIWLIFATLVLMLAFGITAGFVVTSSGRADLKVGYELFVASRHVRVFRPQLLGGVMAVLILGIIPPLIIWAILQAAHRAVRRTHIRELGLKDPLAATAALHAEKLKEQTPTSMMTALSVGGVGVGVMALIVVMSVMSGFEADLQSKILGTNAHAVVLKYTDSFTQHPDEYKDVMEKVGTVKGVIGQTPFIMNEVMISSDQNIAGVIIKGIDPESVGQVTDLPKNVLPGGSIRYLTDPEKILTRRLPQEGILDDLPAEPQHEPDDDPIIKKPKGRLAPEPAKVLPGLLIGRELAASLKVMVGDRVNVVSPLGGELGPQGPMPKSRPFRVAGVFYSGMYEYDSKFVYIHLSEAQSFFDLKGVTGIELKVFDIDDARKIAREVVDKLDGYPYRTKDWGEMNRNLFSALRLEKLVMGIILSIIVIVAAGLIVATVIMLVLEKRKEISVLKALGVSDGGIVKIFLAEGLQIGVAGGLLGLVSGLAWCFFIERVGIKLDPEVYYIPSLPVKIEPFQTALSVFIAVLVTYLGSIYPALKASQVEPVEGLKAE
jgi:lipoprotein-releasing system permease protein